MTGIGLATKTKRMKMKETESFIIFENVPFQAVKFFDDIKYELFFVEGYIDDGLFEATICGKKDVIENIDEEEYENDDKVNINFTLYYMK